MADTATNIHIDHLRVDVPPHPFTIKNKIREDWFDWTWAKSIIDLRDYLLPITWRKFAFYLLYGVMLAAVIATEIVFNWFSLVNPMTWTFLGMTIFMITVEPVMNVFIAFMTIPRPTQNKTSTELGLTQEEVWDRNKDIAVIIPCHTSENVIVNTIKHIVPHIREEQIFIIHNGSSPTPIDSTRDVALAHYPRVNYAWSAIGNKNIAQYIGMKLATQKYKYSLVIDDDVLLPDNFDTGVEMLGGRIKCIAYPLGALPAEGKSKTWLTKSQDIEYKLSGTCKQLQSNTGSALYPHGAIALWETEAFKRVLYEQHDCVFYAEDIKCGIGASRLKYDLYMHSGAYINTQAPMSIFGAAPNFYSQRIRSWDMGEHIHFSLFVHNLFLVWWKGDTVWKTVYGNFIRKVFELYGVYALFMDLLKPAMIAFGFLYPRFWAVVSVAMGLNFVCLVVWRYYALWGRTDVDINLLDLFQNNFMYRPLIMTTRIFGALRAYLIYLPNLPFKPHIKDYENNPDLRGEYDPIWLRPGIEDGTYSDDAYRSEFCNFNSHHESL